MALVNIRRDALNRKIAFRWTRGGRKTRISVAEARGLLERGEACQVTIL